MTNDPTMGELRDTVAIVTGSARNIGRAIALELSTAGAAVVIHAKTSQKDAKAVAREIEAKGGRAMVHLSDISRPAIGRASSRDSRCAYVSSYLASSTVKQKHQ